MALHRVKAGDPITEGLMNDIIDVANRCNLTVAQGGNLDMTSGPGGYTLSAVVPHHIYGKITGPLASGSYPFLEQYSGTGGTWTDGTLTDVAFEQNANPSVPTGKVVKIEVASSGDYVFEYGSC